jgi:hypothetical protein
MNAQLTRREAVERLAYEIYEQEGRPEGHALAHWKEAEKQLSDQDFLEEELKVEEFEGGVVPKS